MFLGLGGVQIHCLFDFISFALILVMFNINVTIFFFYDEKFNHRNCMFKQFLYEIMIYNKFFFGIDEFFFNIQTFIFLFQTYIYIYI